MTIKLRSAGSRLHAGYQMLICDIGGHILWRGRSARHVRYLPSSSLEDSDGAEYVLRRQFVPKTRNRYIVVDYLISTIHGLEARKLDRFGRKNNGIRRLMKLLSGQDTPAGDWCHAWLWEREMIE